tara:strand:+ start:3859 stop:4008 length:150 start_codon:yes stop_codon:yes gene_type:complete
MDWNLPPGVTQAMIDDHFSDHCIECGRVFDPYDEDDETCPQCRAEMNQI